MAVGPFDGDDEDTPYRILQPDGTITDGETVPELDDDRLVTIFEQLRLARTLDDRAISLARQGRLGTYPPMAGQEAAQIASTHALADSDWISYQYREHGSVIPRGLSKEYLLYWMGHEVGNEWLADRNVFPINISIGSHIPHATGLAWASKLSGDDAVVLCHFGDGATSEGDFHEALNFAGVFDVPAIFQCNNNQYAISIHRDRQTASDTIAQKATAYGFEGVRVDGMDPLAMYEVTRRAVERARSTDGAWPRPSLVEAVMYRLGPHTTVDDPSVYREETEVEAWRELDPLKRMEAFLRNRGLVDDERLDAIDTAAAERVDEVVNGAEGYESEPTDMFDHVYAHQTPRISQQQREFEALRARYGDETLLDED